MFVFRTATRSALALAGVNSSRIVTIRMSSSASSHNVAVILAGTGVYDGSEVHEASAAWVHLSRAGAQVSMFAPDIKQMHVVDHTKGEPMTEDRNVLTESARIARGNVKSLTELLAKDFDAVIIPGGFGAAKNLSSFATSGPDMTVLPDVERVLKEFHDAKKPIGLCCIAPVLAAKVFPGCEVTLGCPDEGDKWPFAGACGAAEAMGATHVKKNVNEIHTDENNRIVTTPAFMCNTAVHEIFDGVGAMVNKVLSLVKS